MSRPRGRLFLLACLPHDVTEETLDGQVYPAIMRISAQAERYADDPARFAAVTMAYDAQLNADIVRWLEGRSLGTVFGNGECWTLAEEALSRCRAQTSTSLMGRQSRAFLQGNYVWGDVEPDLNAIRPGDILQMRNHRMTTTTVTRDDLSSQGRSLGPPVVISRPHHTSIVKSVISPGNLLEVFEQNVARPASGILTQSGRVVQINTFPLRTCSAAPVVDWSSGQAQTTIVSYQVSVGTLTAFHPKR